MENQTSLSGIDAVRKIVGTETEARKTIDEAKTRAEQIVFKSRQEGDLLRQEAVSSANQKREQILKQAREMAEAEAQRSDADTKQLLENYRKLAEARKEDAVNKAVELILGS